MTHVLASLTHRIRSSCIEFVPCDTQQHGSRWLWRRFSLCFPFGRVGLVELERSMLVVHAWRVPSRLSVHIRGRTDFLAVPCFLTDPESVTPCIMTKVCLLDAEAAHSLPSLAA